MSKPFVGMPGSLQCIGIILRHPVYNQSDSDKSVSGTR